MISRIEIYGHRVVLSLMDHVYFQDRNITAPADSLNRMSLSVHTQRVIRDYVKSQL